MATIPDILQRKWYGAHWGIEEDDYSTLRWLAADGKPMAGQPSEKTIRDFSDEVDVLIAGEALIDEAPKAEYVTRWTAEIQKWRTADGARLVQK